MKKRNSKLFHLHHNCGDRRLCFKITCPTGLQITIEIIALNLIYSLINSPKSTLFKSRYRIHKLMSHLFSSDKCCIDNRNQRVTIIRHFSLRMLFLDLTQTNILHFWCITRISISTISTLPTARRRVRNTNSPPF